MITASKVRTAASANAETSQTNLAVFLDFDGTLVELAERPDLVVVPRDLPRTLERLKHRLDGALAIVTGRPLDALDDFMAPVRLPAAAAHGTQRRKSDGSLVQPPISIQSASRQIADRLRPLVQSEPRLVLEQKVGAVALHYRQAPDLEDRCRAVIRDAAAAVGEFVVVEGKKVFEARPAGIDKGAAIAQFMRELPFRSRLPVFLGDDRTDEDGFAAVVGLGGFAIKVGAGATVAAHRLPDVDAVGRLIGDLADCPRPSDRLAELLAPSEARQVP